MLGGAATTLFSNLHHQPTPSGASSTGSTTTTGLRSPSAPEKQKWWYHLDIYPAQLGSSVTSTRAAPPVHPPACTPACLRTTQVLLRFFLLDFPPLEEGEVPAPPPPPPFSSPPLLFLAFFFLADPFSAAAGASSEGRACTCFDCVSKYKKISGGSTISTTDDMHGMYLQRKMVCVDNIGHQDHSNPHQVHDYRRRRRHRHIATTQTPPPPPLPPPPPQQQQPQQQTDSINDGHAGRGRGKISRKTVQPPQTLGAKSNLSTSAPQRHRRSQQHTKTRKIKRAYAATRRASTCRPHGRSCRTRRAESPP